MKSLQEWLRRIGWLDYMKREQAKEIGKMTYGDLAGVSANNFKIIDPNHELKQLLDKWQARLGVADWDIRIRWASFRELGDVGGECRPTLVRKEALILVLKRADWDPEAMTFPQDVELTVVHELLHVVFEPFAPERWYSAEGEKVHTAICSLAKSFVNMDRERRIDG